VPLLFGGDPAGRPRIATQCADQITRIFGKTPSCRVPLSGTVPPGRKMRGFTERAHGSRSIPLIPLRTNSCCLGAEYPAYFSRRFIKFLLAHSEWVFFVCVEKLLCVWYNQFVNQEFSGEQMTKYIANILTGCRILGSLLLLFFPVFSLGFYSTYLFCGLTDMIDGTIARKPNSVSEFGSKLDTVADFVFLMVSIFKLLPTIHIPRWLWTWSGVIAIIKIGNFVWGYISKKQFISLHTVLNKVTGLLLFLLPLTLRFVEPIYSSAIVCFMATLSAIHEVYQTMIGKDVF